MVVDTTSVSVCEANGHWTLTLSWAGVVGFGAVALVLVLATRGRLGYRSERHANGPGKNA